MFTLPYLSQIYGKNNLYESRCPDRGSNSQGCYMALMLQSIKTDTLHNGLRLCQQMYHVSLIDRLLSANIYKGKIIQI